ncbi:MAG: protein kinase [Planctomycetes bacterium]|nr:protein kinase [Planctomycetota bacterium]
MPDEFTLATLRKIDALCDQFEEDWKTGRHPRLEDYLQNATTALQPQLLESLQKLQQELILSHLHSSPSPAPDQTLAWDGPRVLLRVVSGPHEGLEFQYDEHDTLLAGRSSEAQLRLQNDPHFSRNHFRLEVNPPACFLLDLGSRNGTYVNGNRVTQCDLQHGDVVSGGRTRIEVSIQTAPGTPAAAPAVASPAVQPAPRPATPIPTNVRRPAPTTALPPQPAAPFPVRPVTPVAPQPVPPPAVVAVAAPDDDAPQIAGYRITGRLGGGDLGTTYRATRLATGEDCALKVITPGGRNDDKAIQAFLREASILNLLQHQHIVRLIEMGASGSNLFLSTEFLPAVTWHELVAKSTTAQRVRLACGLMCQILAALDYAHARSMVHRDVKPGNILIYRHEGKLSSKLSDFGLAKQYTMAGMSRMTRDGDVIGSLPFMSPEQFINSREAKPTCDIYSAGATIYWMLTGCEPILLEHHACKFLAILEDPPVPIRDRCRDLPDALSRVVHRALEKQPSQRFASAAEMRQQLKPFAR